MSLKNIHKISKAKNAEIFVEILDDIIIQQKIGSHIKVDGSRLNRGSDVYHTHLDNHPPSARDYLTGLMCKALYDTHISGVIGQSKIFRYDYKEFLLNKFDKMFLYDDDSQSSEEETVSNKWFDHLRNRIININKNYVKTGNDSIYIRKLARLGIIMSIEPI
jgi:hypothetical protein